MISTSVRPWQDCVANIAEAGVMHYIVVLGEILPSSQPVLLEVLQSTVPHARSRTTWLPEANDAGAATAVMLGSRAVLASYSKLVAELLSKGVLIYLLNIFCNATNPDNRHAAAAVFAKLIADKVCTLDGTNGADSFN